MGSTVTMISPEGASVDIPEEQVDAYAARQFRLEDPTERAARVTDSSLNDQTSSLSALGRAALRGVTLGGSDAAAVGLLGENERIKLNRLQEAHPYLSLGGQVYGQIALAAATGGESAAAEGGLAAAGDLGAESAARSSFANALGGAVVRNAAEGAVYGAGNAVSDLALSDDPLTAEHVASSLSSNMLLGGAIGGVAGAGSKLFERGLQIAGEKIAAASAARDALTGLPEDLQGLDDAGLKDAYAGAKADHAADVQAEKTSLQQIRANQRAEMANRVKDLHEDLATERPIFQALSTNEELTPALKDIEGVSDARVQLAKSYKSMRAAFDSPLSVERDPSSLIRPLEQRQAALEALQGKGPELQAALAGDARAQVLEHVDGALQDTKDQIAAIRWMKEAPVSSGRLTALEAGPSARMQAIDDARAAMKQAPELGLVGKGAKGAAFAGGTALAHMIPGVGIAAPFIGKAVSDAVEKVFQRGASAIGKVGAKASAAAEKFVTATKALEPYVAPTATKVLSTVRFGASKGGEVADDDLVGLYKARTAELYGQTMRQPDGTTTMRPDARAAMAKQLDPLRAVNPLLADKVETVKARAITTMANAAPKKPEAPGLQIGPDNSRPPDMAIRAWARVVRAVEDPSSVEERLARGIVTPEEANAYRTVYPERFAALQREIFQAAPLLEKTLPMNKKVALSIFTGIPVTPAMQPNVIAVLQSTFDVEPGSAGGTQAPRPQPNFSRFGSMKDNDKPTPSQERQQ